MKHRMRKRIICGIILCSGALCLADTWTWSGDGADDKWDTCENWGPSACTKIVGYPSTTNDDVTFSLDDTVELISEQIDDMLISYDITFNGANDAKLTVDSLILQGPTTGTTILIVKGGAELLADGTNP